MVRLTLADKTLNRHRMGQRRAAAPDALNYTDGLWHDGFDTNDTVVTVTGTQTLTYPTPDQHLQLTVVPSGQSANDLNCLLTPASIPVGSKWRSDVSIYTSSATGHYLMAALVLTNGITSSSSVMSTLYYKQDASTTTSWIGAWDGTLTNVGLGAQSSVTSSGTASLRWQTWTYEIEYSAANTYIASLYPRRSPDAYYSSGSISHTMTPSHVGIGWSTWGDSPADAEIIAGPVYRYA